MAKRCLYSVLLIAVLVVAGVSVFLCISGSKRDKDVTDDTPYDEALRESAQTQSILVSYEAGEDLSPECREYLLQQASGAAQRRRRRLGPGNDVLQEALESLTTLFESAFQNKAAPEQENFVVLSSELQERRDHAALELALLDISTSSVQEGGRRLSESESGITHAKLIRDVVGPSVWSALAARKAAASQSVEDRSDEKGIEKATTLSTAGQASYPSYDEDQLLLRSAAVASAQNEIGAEATPEPVAVVGSARWLKHIEVDLVRAEDNAALQNALSAALSLPCVVSAERETIIPVLDGKSRDAAPNRRRLFSFGDFVSGAKAAASSAGKWIADNLPEEVTSWYDEKVSPALSSASQKVQIGWRDFVEKMQPEIQNAWEGVTKLGNKAGQEVQKAIEKAQASVEPDSDAAVALKSLQASVATALNVWENAVATNFEKLQDELLVRRNEPSNDSMSTTAAPPADRTGGTELAATEDSFDSSTASTSAAENDASNFTTKTSANDTSVAAFTTDKSGIGSGQFIGGQEADALNQTTAGLQGEVATLVRDARIDTLMSDARQSMTNLLLETEQQILTILATRSDRTTSRNTRGGNVPVGPVGRTPLASDALPGAETPLLGESLLSESLPSESEWEKITASEDEDSIDAANTISSDRDGKEAAAKHLLLRDGVLVGDSRVGHRTLSDHADRNNMPSRRALVRAVMDADVEAAASDSAEEEPPSFATDDGRAEVARVVSSLTRGLNSRPNDALYSKQWSLPVVDAATARLMAPNGMGKNEIPIAVLDTGCDVNHEDLIGRVWRNDGEICGDRLDNDGNGYPDDCYGWNFYSRNSDLVEMKIHGTSVSGAVLADTGNRVGVASPCDNCRLMCLRVGNTGFSTSAFAEAVNYALAHGVKVINYSGNGARSATQERALLEAAKKDVSIIVSSGNVKCNLDSKDSCTADAYPALLPNDNIITVGASTESNVSASYSSYGAKTVDVYAPAGDLLPQPNNNYALMSGTSFSAPIVTSLVGMIRSSYPQLSAGQVKDAIVKSCYRHSELKDKSRCKGIVDFAAAITAAAKAAGKPL